MQKPENNSKGSSIDVEKLYPELDEQQRSEAAFYLGRYLDVVQRIFERVNGLTRDTPDDRL